MITCLLWIWGITMASMCLCNYLFLLFDLLPPTVTDKMLFIKSLEKSIIPVFGQIHAILALISCVLILFPQVREIIKEKKPDIEKIFKDEIEK